MNDRRASLEPFLPRPATSDAPEELDPPPMGVNLSTAKWLAPLSFIFDFALQQYGMMSTPNMKQIHDKNLSFYSPYPYSILAFFAPQQILQLIWLRKLFTPAVTREQLDYVPFYAIGNVCIGLWMFAWNSERFNTSMAFVAINSLSQLYYVCARLPAYDSRNWATHLVATTFAGIGVLDFLHNGSVTFANHQYANPSLLIKVLTGVGFLGGATLSNPTMSACLVWDLAGLAIGQSGSWRNLLGAYAVGAGAIAGYRHLVAK